MFEHITMERPCTATCWTPVICATCHRRKAPVGRSVAMESTNGSCNDSCSGYYGKPDPPHLWSEHDSDRAYVDAEGWKAHVAGCDLCRIAEPSGPSESLGTTLSTPDLIRDQLSILRDLYVKAEKAVKEDDLLPGGQVEAGRHGVVEGIVRCAHHLFGFASERIVTHGEDPEKLMLRAFTFEDAIRFVESKHAHVYAGQAYLLDELRAELARLRRGGERGEDPEKLIGGTRAVLFRGEKIINTEDGHWGPCKNANHNDSQEGPCARDWVERVRT